MNYLRGATMNAASNKHIVMFVPTIFANETRFSLVATATALAGVANQEGWELTVLARACDMAGSSVPWPSSVFTALKAAGPTQKDGIGFPATLEEDCAQLLAIEKPIDVLYLPQPWGCLPSDCRTNFPAPLVVGLDDLFFEHIDLGSKRERYQREMARLADQTSMFLFRSNTCAMEAIQRYNLSKERCHVVASPPFHTKPTPAHIAAVRKRFKLPDRFLFQMGGFRPEENTLTQVQALGHLRARHGQTLPLVVGSTQSDVAPFASLTQLDYAERCREALAEAGMCFGTDYLDLGVVDEDEATALIAAATGVVAAHQSAGRLPWTIQRALEVGTPVLYSNIPAFLEEMSKEDQLARPFTPNDPEELADQIHETLLGKAKQRPGQTVRLSGGQGSDLSAWGTSLLDQLETATRLWKTRPRQTTASRPMVPREKRVAWLLTHTTLRDAEAPLLRSLGYEVWTPKVLPRGVEHRSGSADCSWDLDSTLPTHVLRALNEFNFYQDTLTPDIIDKLNGYFGTVFTDVYSSFKIKELIIHYKGRILVRAFGREHPMSYGQYIGEYLKGDFWWRVRDNQERFWLAACYDSIPPIEHKLLRDRAVILPVAMPEHIFRCKGQWLGCDKRVYFVCPSIKTSPGYYGVIYEQFKKTYGDMPHLIGGLQSVPVDDPCVTGYVSDERMRKTFRDLRVMYYHSREPRHIHYHPLEAIVYGMPVVYMRGGLMEAHDKGSQAGACDTDAEAREKLQRILDGDEELIAAIQESQQTILDIFLPDNVRQEWERIFVGQIMRDQWVADLCPLAPARPGENTKNVVGPLKLHDLSTAELFSKCKANAESSAVTHTPVPDQPPFEANGFRQRVKGWIPQALQRPARWLFKGGMIAALYSRAAIRQRRLLPAGTGIGAYLPGVWRAAFQARPVQPPAFNYVEWDLSLLKNPPPLEKRPTLPALQRVVSLGQVWSTLHPRDMTLIVNPFGVLDPNQQAYEQVLERLVILYTHLEQEYSDYFGPYTEGVQRETALWMRLAHRVVFANEELRTLAIQRYGLPAERTAILPVSTLTGPITPASFPRPVDVCGRWKLPLRYILGTGSNHPQDNTLVLLEALAILRKRRISFPALVLVNREEADQPFILRDDFYEKELERARNAAGLLSGQNLFQTPLLTEPELTALESNATLCVVTSRSETYSAQQSTRASLLRVPVVGCENATLLAHWGADDNCLLLRPAHDPLGLADALEYTLHHPEATAQRVECARQRVQAENGEERLTALQQLLEASRESELEAVQSNQRFRTAS